ncbi:MAG: hypothetical protein IPM35_25365 [Myxococcales bacterium]|nr:hypothetical protein [Myxococcales bacterium]
MLASAASGRIRLLRLLPSALSIAALLALLSAGCQERSGAPEPAGSPSATSTATPPASTPPNRQAADAWLGVRKGGRDLGVVEVLAGKPWRVVLHSGGEDARLLEKLVTDHGSKPLALSMHLPPEKPGERGPYGSRNVAPGDPLYRHAVEEHLRGRGFDVDANVPRFVDRDPPASVRKLELSRDGAKVGTLDLSATPAKLELVNREANALFLESFWKGLDAEEQLSVSYLPPAGGRDALTTVSAKKGSPEYARMVRLAFAVRYPAYSLVVTP